jgi:hypothetical protein
VSCTGPRVGDRLGHVENREGGSSWADSGGKLGFGPNVLEKNRKTFSNFKSFINCKLI